MPRSATRSFLLAACLGGLALPVAASTPVPPAPLRVMSFNVRVPVDSDGANRWEKRRDLMVSTIRAEHPDVMGTQELVARQGDYLAAHLHGYAWFGMGRQGDDRDEHMGVFYRTDRLRILAAGNFWLSDTPEVPGSITWEQPLPRMVTWARFLRIADGRTFVLFDTHLPYREQDTDARNRGAALILKRLAGLPADEPFVLTGDFNSAPDTAVHARLTAVLHDAWDSAPKHAGPTGTFHGFTGTPQDRIDWILLRGFRALDVRTVTMQRGGHYPSDHFPVVADLAWPATQEPSGR